MRRRLSIFAIMLLLIMQSTPVGNISFATVEEDKHFDVQVDQQLEEESATIRVTAKETSYDTVSILLPARSSYSEKLTNNLENRSKGLSYDATNHSLKFTVNDKEEIDIEFVLSNFETPEQGLVVQGLKSGEKLIEETHEFNIDQQSEDPTEAPEIDEVEPKESSSEEDRTKDDATEDKSSTNEQMVQPMVGDLNTDIDISPVNYTILSGEDALYKLSLKLTGSKRVYKDVELVVDLPISEHVTFDDSDLANIAINDVTPDFNSETDQLTYVFDEIARGQTYEKVIKLQTENGYILTGEEASATASVSGDIHFTENDDAEDVEQGDVVPFEFEDNATVTIEATSGVSITKTIESPSNEVARRGDEVIWKIEVIVPKIDKGQLFLKPGETIQITDQIPDYLTFNEMVDGDSYTRLENKLLTWEFTADDFEEQEANDDELFTKTLTFKTTVGSNAPEHDYITNEAAVQATFIDDKVDTNDATKSVYISGGQPGSGEIEGSVFVPSHLGPLNGEGSIAPSSNKNPVPQVYDDANLRFGFYTSPLRESRPTNQLSSTGQMVMGNEVMDFEEYMVVYDIDENLNIESLRTPTNIEYQPGSTFDRVPFLNPPVFEIRGIVDGTERVLLEAADAKFGTTYTREQLGLLPGEKISRLTIDFEYAPGGMQSTQWQVGFSVEPGYTGPVQNIYNVIGRDGLNSSISDFNHMERYPGAYENGNTGDLAGPRQATIIPRPAEADPVGEVGVRLLEHQGGLVTPGTNRMQLNLTNVNNSPAPMHEPLESVVLLPPGVQLSEQANPSYTDARGNETDVGSFEIVTDDYNGSGRQLIQVSWDDARMTKGQELLAELDVDISENAPSNLTFDVYGFSGDAGLTAPNYDDYVITNTILQIDEEDLNGDGVTDQPRLKSGNMYSMTSDYDLQIEKLIKGPNDEEYSKFTMAPFDETVEYKLMMTNTTGKEISSMTLIDVLPSIGDLGITDNINRGSTFEPILEGPITIPDEWENKVNVFYSTAANPERDDLTRYTNYPDSTAPLTNPEGAEEPNWMTASDVSDWNSIHSFKIELAQGSTWIKGQDIEIDFSMKMPSEADVEDDVKNVELYPQQRAAWNSFAVATDAGQPVEPERVGVAIERFIDIPVEKIWEGEAQDEVTINLLADDETVSTIVLSDENNWKHVFGDLPVANGIEAINYTIEEVSSDGYDTNITGTAEEGFVVTNTELTDISVEKVWEGEAQNEVTINLLADGEEVATIELSDANDWEHVFENLPAANSDGAIFYTVEEVVIDGYETTITGSEAEGFVVTNTELMNIPVEKVWEGAAQDGVTINLLADGEEVSTIDLSDENDWQHVFENVPVANSEDTITYTVEEVSIDGYDTKITGSAEEGFVVTNIEVTNITVEKVWEGEPRSMVTINLLAGDKEVGKIVLNDEKDWEHVFENLPVVNEEGPITYTVVEVGIDGYETNITGTAEEGFVVTNSELTNISVEKVWEGESTDEVTINLLADGEEAGTIVLSAENDWQHLFEDLPVVNGEEAIDYTVEEVEIDGYKTSITGSAEEGFVITNTELTDIPVEKVWEGEAQEDVTINLLADGEEVSTVDLSDENDWQHVFEDLPVASGEDTIIYTVEEVSIDGYDTNITGNAEEGFVVTNTELTDIPVEKVWEGEAADEVTINLLANGEEVDTIDLSGANDWQHIFEGLPVAKGEDMIVYTVEEVDIDGYDTIITGNAEDGFVVTNTLHPPETPGIEKEVEDDDGEFGKELVEKEREKSYKYNINTIVPEDVRGYEYLTLEDELDERLDVLAAVALVNGEEVDLNVTIDGQLVKLQLDREQLNEIVGQELTLQITAQIKAGVEVEVIDNQASIQVNDHPKKDSNIVQVTPVEPPTTPEIAKDVEGTDHIDVDYDKGYKYNVITKLPATIEAYEKFMITDNVDQGLVVIAKEVEVTVDGEPYDGLTLTIDENHITVDVTNFAGLEGKREIELIIPAKIHPDTNVDDYPGHLIPNTASLQYINESGEEKVLETEPVTVTPKESQPIEVPGEEKGEELPKTATNTYNFILIGIVLILIGIGSVFIRKRMQQ